MVCCFDCVVFASTGNVTRFCRGADVVPIIYYFPLKQERLTWYSLQKIIPFVHPAFSDCFFGLACDIIPGVAPKLGRHQLYAGRLGVPRRLPPVMLRGKAISGGRDGTDNDPHPPVAP